MSGDPFVEVTSGNDTIQAVRKRKGLKDGVPQVVQYLDKL